MSISPRQYYEDLYSKHSERNPALKIYDSIRINVILELIGESHGPVLVIGCGSNLDLRLADISESVVFTDLSLNALKQTRKESYKQSVADVLGLPFPDSSFKLIVCSEVLEHVPDIHQAVIEMKRVICDDGILIVSSPNWWSFFGLARRLGEFVTGHPVHASDQPIDNWKTPISYRKELSPNFIVRDTRGVWYLPPMHYRGKGISQSLTGLIYKLFRPFEKFFGKNIPWFGHMLVLRCIPANEK